MGTRMGIRVVDDADRIGAVRLVKEGPVDLVVAGRGLPAMGLCLRSVIVHETLKDDFGSSRAAPG